MKFEDLASREIQQRKRVLLSPAQLLSLAAGLQRLESGQVLELQVGNLLLEVGCQCQDNQEIDPVYPVPGNSAYVNQTNSSPIPFDEYTYPEVVSTLHDRIEGLIIADSALNCDPMEESPLVVSRPQHEDELAAIRKQVQILNPEGEEETAIRKELDIAEDISMGVASGQDPKKLYVQLALVEKGLLQLRGRRAMQEAAKAVSGITAKRTSEKELRRLQQSKDRILAEILRNAESKPAKTANLATPKPVIVSLETVSSAMDSPAASRIIDFDFLLDKRERETELRKRLEAVEDRVDKLRHLLKEQQSKLQRYRDAEKQLLVDKARLRTSERRLQLYKNTLEALEMALFAREQEIAAKTDALRDEAAELVGRDEAVEYLALKAEALEQENHRIALENTLIALKRTEIVGEKEEIAEVRRLLESQNRQLERERQGLDREKALVVQSKAELEHCLPLLRRFQAGN